MFQQNHPEFVPTGNKWGDLIQIVGIYIPNVLAVIASIIAMRRAGRAAQSSQRIEHAVEVEHLVSDQARAGTIDRRK